MEFSKRGRDDDENGEPEDENTEETKAGLHLLQLTSESNLEGVASLLASGVPPSFQDEESGSSVLMVAAATGCLPMVQLLLQSGAPWNALDRQGRCAGEYAVDSGNQDVIDAIVNAGVASELLFGALDREEKRAQTAAAMAASRGAADVAVSHVDAAAASAAPYDAHHPAAPGQYLEDRGVRYDGDRLVDSADDAVMMAWEAPLMEAHADILLAHGLDAFGDLLAPLGIDPATSVQAYAAAAGAGAAAAAEGASSAGALSAQSSGGGDGGGGMAGRVVLNVGFGMGIVDRAIQRRGPAHHFIIEAHPAVFERMVEEGWGVMPNVTLVFGRWQDVIAGLGPFDGVFFDTYGERYSDMTAFHEQLPRLLKPGGVYSFFNGMCPFNIFFHGVACELVKTELSALSIRTVFVPLQVSLDPATWAGVARKYWQRDVYYLPICVYTP